MLLSARSGVVGARPGTTRRIASHCPRWCLIAPRPAPAVVARLGCSPVFVSRGCFRQAEARCARRPLVRTKTVQ
eukprot:3580300-Lingulodinium_polyedra.AAC.1